MNYEFIIFLFVKWCALNILTCIFVYKVNTLIILSLRKFFILIILDVIN